jgi:hypothetical protein
VEIDDIATSAKDDAPVDDLVDDLVDEDKD